MDNKNPYDILEVDPDASDADIKEAYHKKAKASHSDCGGSDEDMALINYAYDILKDPLKRERYDLGEEPETKPGASKAVQTFLGVAKKVDDFKHTDIIEKSIKTIEIEVSGIHENIEKHEKAVKNILEIKKRIIHTQGDNSLFSMVMQQEADRFKKTIAGLKGNISQCENAIEILREYKYDFEEMLELPSPDFSNLNQYFSFDKRSFP